MFNVWSCRWGGLAANLISTNNIDDRVYGAIYRILNKKLDVLTQYETEKPEDIPVEADGVSIKAQAYIFKPSREPGKTARCLSSSDADRLTATRSFRRSN